MGASARQKYISLFKKNTLLCRDSVWTNVDPHPLFLRVQTAYSAIIHFVDHVWFKISVTQLYKRCVAAPVLHESLGIACSVIIMHDECGMKY